MVSYQFGIFLYNTSVVKLLVKLKIARVLVDVHSVELVEVSDALFQDPSLKMRPTFCITIMRLGFRKNSRKFYVAIDSNSTLHRRF